MLKNRVVLFLKGCAMGAADVVPGVSGGTIAFITGIYETLLESISKIDKSIFSRWKNEGFKSVWKHVNGPFLLTLILGIGTSLLSLSKLVTFLLKNHPIQVWSFFFGLVLASIWLVGKTVDKWNAKTIIALVLGAIVAYLITILPPLGDSGNLLYIFFCGTIAICAMILPGVSGSFILLLLGAYATVLAAASDLLSSVKALDMAAIFANGTILGVFAFGCLVGLLSFSRLLNYLFKKAKNIVIAILTGFLIGSLNKIWPWKQTLTSFIKHAGEENEEIVPLTQKNIGPAAYEIINDLNPFLTQAIIFGLIGILILVILDRFKVEETVN